MSSPLSARTIKGAIVALSLTGPPRIVTFQYNPDEVTRSITPHDAPASHRTSDIRRLWGAPSESLSLTLELDAGDSVGDGNTLAGIGVRARIAALQLLLTPDLVTVIANTALQAAGSIEIVPPTAPLTVLTLGPGRTVPVAIESITVTEQAFDQLLTPIRASVQLRVRVLTYSDLPLSDPGHVMSIVQQGVDETASLLAPAVAIAEV